MKYILPLILLFTSSLYSQSRLGSSRSEIYSEFQSLSPEFGATEDGTPTMSVMFGRSYTRYFFDDNNICNFVAIVPNRQGDLNYYVELYNKQYVVVSATAWKMYSKDGNIATIELVTQNGVSMFVWTFER